MKKLSVKSFSYLVMGGMLLLSGSALAQTAKDLFLDKCAVCHGADGHAKTKMGKKSKTIDIKDSIVKFSEEEMRKTVENGKKPNMDAWGKEFNKDQIKGLVEYYRSLAK